jgi:hypothetical protein
MVIATRFENLTPHAINLPNELVIPASGTVARCKEFTKEVGTFGGVTLIRKEYGDVTDLPDPVGGVMYIVSALVRLAVPERIDVASPGDLIRGEGGVIIGAANLAVNM